MATEFLPSTIPSLELLIIPYPIIQNGLVLKPVTMKPLFSILSFMIIMLIFSIARGQIIQSANNMIPFANGLSKPVSISRIHVSSWC